MELSYFVSVVLLHRKTLMEPFGEAVKSTVVVVIITLIGLPTVTTYNRLESALASGWFEGSVNGFVANALFAAIGLVMLLEPPNLIENGFQRHEGVARRRGLLDEVEQHWMIGRKAANRGRLLRLAFLLCQRKYSGHGHRSSHPTASFHTFYAVMRDPTLLFPGLQPVLSPRSVAARLFHLCSGCSCCSVHVLSLLFRYLTWSFAPLLTALVGICLAAFAELCLLSSLKNKSGGGGAAQPRAGRRYPERSTNPDSICSYAHPRECPG
eukprot:6214786-Pleurochrysis_carterae.AAC.3